LLSAQRKGDGTIHVSISMQEPSGTAADRQLDGWDPQFRRLVDACDEPWTVRPINVLPIGLTWPRRSGVTLLGDAAHLMQPVGEGANLAMLHAADLGHAIAKHPDDLDAALAEYEPAMQARAARVAKQSAEVAELLTGPDAAQKVLRFFQPRSSTSVQV
jgi:2-polyprenyl-6-methoxyphenol hydroxylase-like FAD-dependent oxidoreductase